MSLRTIVPAVLAALLVLPGSAGAAGPAVQVAPQSGGPGTPVTVTGSGFCARPGCGAVRITMSGRQFAADQRPDAAGRFRASTRAPGGLEPGEHEIVARQVLDDGNEISASASFVYSPSKGEAAEREAENRDAVNSLVNPTAPTPSPRGGPFGSGVAPTGGASGAATAGGGTDATSVAGDAGGNGLNGLAVAGLAAAGIAVLATGATLWRRRRLGGDS